MSTTAPAHFFRCEFATLADLQHCYIDLFKYGGVFVKTKDLPALKEEVAILIQLPDQTRLMPVGTVAWINPVHGHRPPGIGVAFSIQHREIQDKITELLAKMPLKSPDNKIV